MQEGGSLLFRWLVAAVTVGVAAYLLPGVQIDSFIAALVAALVLGAVNILLKPLLVILTLPLTVMTLGLFLFVINAFLVWVTALVVPGFTVAGFGSALLFSLLVSLVSSVLSLWAREDV